MSRTLPQVERQRLRDAAMRRELSADPLIRLTDDDDDDDGRDGSSRPEPVRYRKRRPGR